MTVDEAIDQLHDMAVNEYPEDVAAVAVVRKEIERLQYIVDRLPKTADGAPIVPGMALWYRSPAGIIETPPLDTWAEIEGMIAEDEDYGPDTFYSTRAAAEAAESEKP